MPLKDIVRNKILLQKNHGFQEISIDNWPFWLFEENIKVVNEIIEEEEKQRKKEEESQSKQKGADPSSYLKSLSGISNKFKP
jgi:hypothetical protein